MRDQDKAKGDDAYGRGGVKEKAPFGTKGAENEGRGFINSAVGPSFFQILPG